MDGAVGNTALSIEHAVHNGLLVDCVVKYRNRISIGFPKRRIHIHGCPAVISGFEIPVGELILAPELGSILGIKPSQIRFACFQHGGLRAFHGHGLVDDAFDIGHFAVIVLVTCKGNHPAIFVPLHKFVAPCPYRFLIEGGSIHILAFQQMLGQNAYGEIPQHVGTVFLQLDYNRVIIRRRHTGNILVVAGHRTGQRLILRQHVIGEYHVLRGKFFPIMPFYALTQLEGIGKIFPIKAVTFSQILHRLATAIILHEARKDQIPHLIMGTEHRIDGALIFPGIDQRITELIPLHARTVLLSTADKAQA